MKIIPLIISLFSCFTLQSQTVTNGSVTGTPEGNDLLANATGWSSCTLSPDLCSVTFSSYAGTTQVSASPSPDGGTWLGLAALGECATTTITGLSIGKSYSLCFYGACFGTGFLFNNSPSTPSICVGTTCQTFVIPMVANTWNQFTMNFTATANTMLLTASLSNTYFSYASLDGFRVGSFGKCTIPPIGDSICKGEQAMIYTTGGNTYNWYKSGFPATSLGTNDTLYISPNSTTDYVVTIDGINDTVTVFVHPVYSIQKNISICQGDSILLSGSFQTIAGVYNDTLKTIKGCDSILVTTLAIIPISTSNLTASICQGDSILLGGFFQTIAGIYKDTISGTASGCDSIITTHLIVNSVVHGSIIATICNDSNYLFKNVNLTVAGIYKDTLTSASGCDSIVTLSLTVNPVLASGFNHSICSGSSYLFNGTMLTSNGNYNDTLTSASGCDSIITLSLTVNPLPTIGISSDVVLTKGSSTTLTATGGNIYNWIPSIGLNISTGNTVISTPDNTITYCVTGMNAQGCIDSICVTVTVLEPPIVPCNINKEGLKIANAFSPNADSNNDEFCLQGWEICSENFSIHIYNRWGEKVFESNNPLFCWDGTLRGQPLDPNVFIYVIEAKFHNQSKKIKKTGNITLIK